MTLAPFLHPTLSRWPAEQRREVLREARRTPLDVFELMGMACALILAIVLMRGPGNVGEATFALESGTPESIAAGALAGAVIVALLLFRRTRRGLRRLAPEGRRP